MMIALMAVAMTIMNEMIAVRIVLVVMHSLTTMEIRRPLQSVERVRTSIYSSILNPYKPQAQSNLQWISDVSHA